MSTSFQPDQAATHDEWGSSSSSASSSTASSPCPPLPDSVLRSLQFPNQQRANAVDGNITEGPPGSAGQRVHNSRSAQVGTCGVGTAANCQTHGQSQNGMALSRLSDHDLDLIIANLETRASERRKKIRKIEALSEELGLSVHEQDWVALLDRQSSGSSRSISARERTQEHEELQPQSDATQNVGPTSMPIPETRASRDSVVMGDGSANSFSDLQAEFEAPHRFQRLQRGLKRAHGHVEQQRSGAADCHEDGEANIVHSPRLPTQIQPLTPEAGESENSGQVDSPIISVHGGARRTAWSVVLETYPEEIATRFRPGQRPTSTQIQSMLDLPAVNSLVNNPMRRSRTLGWHIDGLGPSRQNEHLISVLIQITGVAAPDPCSRCQKGSGLWAGCYLRPAAARGVQNLACANCMYNASASKCHWKQGPALP